MNRSTASELCLFDCMRLSRLERMLSIRLCPNTVEMSVLRWGDSSNQPSSEYAPVSAVQANQVYQSLIACGTERGGLFLFRNEFACQVSINRTMAKEILRGSTRPSSDAHRKPVTSVRFMEEHVLVSGSLDGSIRVWDCTSTNRTQEVTTLASRDGISSLEVVRCFGSSAVLVTGTDAGALHLRDLRSSSGEGDKSSKSNTAAVTSICMDNSFSVFSGNSFGEMELRDLRSLQPAPLLCLNGSKEAQEQSIVQTIKEWPKVTRRSKVDISEDLWDIAMGKASNKRALKREPVGKPVAHSSSSVAPQKVAFENAHAGRIVHIGIREPNQIISVAQDRDVKVFCATTGLLLKTLKLKDKPLSAVYFNKSLYLGERNGLRVLLDHQRGFQEALGLSNPHMGSVTALSPCADWGLCTGGSDAHVFIHGL